MSKSNETAQKATKKKYNTVREHGRTYLRLGLEKLFVIRDEKQAPTIVKNANAAERLGAGKGRVYLDKLGLK